MTRGWRYFCCVLWLWSCVNLASAAVCVTQSKGHWTLAYPSNPPCSTPDQQIVVSQNEWKQEFWAYDNELMKIGFMGSLLCWVTGFGVGLVISVVRKARVAS